MNHAQDPRLWWRGEHARLARAVAATARFSARVHEEMADVHDQLAAPLLDPEDLRRHAEADRRWAGQEEASAWADDLSPPGSAPHPDQP